MNYKIILSLKCILQNQSINFLGDTKLLQAATSNLYKKLIQVEP